MMPVATAIMTYAEELLTKASFQQLKTQLSDSGSQALRRRARP